MCVSVSVNVSEPHPSHILDTQEKLVQQALAHEVESLGKQQAALSQTLEDVIVLNKKCKENKGTDSI